MAQDSETVPAVGPEAQAEPQKESDTAETNKEKDAPQAPEEAAADDPKKASDDAATAADATANGASTPAADESPAAKVARLWSEHSEKDEALRDADRLAVSSAYRKWSATADLGLAEGVSIPAFTEVWVVLETAKAKAKSSDRKPADDKGSRNGQASSTLSGVNTVSAKRARAKADTAGADSVDLLADFAAEAHKVYKRDAEDGAKSPDAGEGKDRPKDAQNDSDLKKDGDKDKRSRSPERQQDRRSPGRTASRLDRSRGREHRRERSRDRQRERGGGDNPEFSKDRSIEMFDEALRHRGGRGRGGMRRPNQDRGGRGFRGRGDRSMDRGGGRGRDRNDIGGRYRSRTPARGRARDRGDSHGRGGRGGHDRGRGYSNRGAPPPRGDHRRERELPPEYEYSYAHEYSDEEFSKPPPPPKSRRRY